MSEDSVMAYWIEADTLEFCSKRMGSADLRGRTYESEIMQRYAREPLDSEILVFPLSQIGHALAKSEIQRLKSKIEARQRSGGQ